MKSFTIVKHLNVFEYILLSLGSGLIVLMMDQFCFQGMEEAFRDTIIPTVAFAAHALGDAIFLQ